MTKKKSKSGNKASVSDNQQNITMAVPSGGVSASNFAGLETSTILNQANNVLYPPYGQVYASDQSSVLQPQPMMQNPPPNRQYMSSMNNNMNTNYNMNGQSYAQMNTIQPSAMPTSFGNNGQGNVTSQGSGHSVFDLVQQMSSQINNRLTGIEQNMSKLTMIENNISCVRTEVSSLKSDNVVFRTNLGEMERVCQAMSGFMDDYNKKHSSTETYLKKLEHDYKTLRCDYSTIKQENETLVASVSSMKEKLLEMEARSMRANLLFFGIEESAENIRDRSYREDTETLLKRFIADEITFPEGENLDPYDIKFERVHRLGRPKFDQNGRLLRPRPVVAAFSNFKERETVWRASSTIKDRTHSVREQFPAEIEERRKTLYPFLKSAKSMPFSDAKLVRDKLIVNGTTYTHKDVAETSSYGASNANTYVRPPPPWTTQNTMPPPPGARPPLWCTKRVKSGGTGAPLFFYRCTGKMYRWTAKYYRCTAIFTGGLLNLPLHR